MPELGGLFNSWRFYVAASRKEREENILRAPPRSIPSLLARRNHSFSPGASRLDQEIKEEAAEEREEKHPRV